MSGFDLPAGGEDEGLVAGTPGDTALVVAAEPPRMVVTEDVDATGTCVVTAPPVTGIVIHVVVPGDVDAADAVDEGLPAVEEDACWVVGETTGGTVEVEAAGEDVTTGCEEDGAEDDVDDVPCASQAGSMHWKLF